MRPGASRKFEEEMKRDRTGLRYSYTIEGLHLPYANHSIYRTMPRPFACACVRQRLTPTSRHILIVGLPRRRCPYAVSRPRPRPQSKSKLSPSSHSSTWQSLQYLPTTITISWGTTPSSGKLQRGGLAIKAPWSIDAAICIYSMLGYVRYKYKYAYR
jgi:hypothetical protein